MGTEPFPTLDDVRRRQAARALGLPLSSAWATIRAAEGASLPSAPPCATGQEPLGSGWSPAPSPRLDPLTLTLPWSSLVSDNKHYAPGLRNGAPVVLLTPAYRQAKERAHSIAMHHALQGGGAPVFPVGDLALDVVLWTPRAHNLPDLVAPMKCLADALEGACYTNDRQLAALTWRRAGVDIDRPRVELTLTPL